MNYRTRVDTNGELRRVPDGTKGGVRMIVPELSLTRVGDVDVFDPMPTRVLLTRLGNKLIVRDGNTVAVRE